MTDQPQTEQPPRIVDAESGGRLHQLHGAYLVAKAEADAAGERFKACSDAIKLELNSLDPDETRFTLRSPDLPPLVLTHTEQWSFDSKKFKAEDPHTYVQYARKSSRWTLQKARGQ